MVNRKSTTLILERGQAPHTMHDRNPPRHSRSHRPRQRVDEDGAPREATRLRTERLTSISHAAELPAGRNCTHGTDCRHRPSGLRWKSLMFHVTTVSSI
jgi:hypothetical protein